MKRLLILCTLFFLVLRIAAQCPGPAQRTALINLQKAGIVESSRAGQIPLTDACGNQRYAQYVEVDLVPISYTPSSTGNTQNYSEFVTTTSGDIWFVDWQGRGIKLWNNAGGSGASDYDWLTISDNTIPDNIQDSIYTGKYASVNMRRVWPNAQMLVGDSTGTNGASGIVAGDRSARWGFVRMLDSTWSSIGQEGTTNAIRLGPGTTAMKISVAAGPSPSQATAPFRDVASFRTDSLIRFNDYPNTRNDTATAVNFFYSDAQGNLRSKPLSGVSGGSGTPIEYCTDTITQASHGFSVGTPIRHNGTSWVSTIGAYGNTISATGVVVKSITSNQFVVANCGSFPTVIASGSYYQIDASPGYGVVPDTLQVPLFKVEAGQMFVNPVFGITAGETLNFVDGSSVDFTKSGSNVTAEITGFNAATNGYVPSKNGTSVTWIPAPTGATGSAGGDLSGTYPNPNVKKIQGDSVSTTNPTSNQALVWNGSAYVPTSIDVSAADDLTGSGGANRVAYWSSSTNLTGTTSFIHDPAQGLIVGALQINGYGTGAGWTGQGFTSAGANRTLYLKCGTNNNASDIAGLVIDAGVLSTRTASTAFEGVRMASDLQTGPGTLTTYTFFKQIPLLRHSLTTFIGNDYDPQGMVNATNHYAQLYRLGKVGFNVSAPTAKVHIGAGTTTEAPFKLTRTSAALTTTPEDGAIEVDATDLYHTIGTTRVKLTLEMREENFTATAGQTDFTIAYSAPAVSGTNVPIRVYRNGVRLFYVASGPTATQFTFTGTTVTTSANNAGDIVTIEYLN